LPRPRIWNIMARIASALIALFLLAASASAEISRPNITPSCGFLGPLVASVCVPPPPEVFEAGGGELRIANRVLKVLVAEIGLQGARVVPRIGQRIAAGVAQHVRMHLPTMA
jgi:hypothetical protein